MFSGRLAAPGVDPAVIWVVLLAALIAGGATAFQLFRSGR